MTTLRNIFYLITAANAQNGGTLFSTSIAIEPFEGVVDRKALLAKYAGDHAKVICYVAREDALPAGQYMAWMTLQLTSSQPGEQVDYVSDSWSVNVAEGSSLQGYCQFFYQVLNAPGASVIEFGFEPIQA